MSIVFSQDGNTEKLTQEKEETVANLNQSFLQNFISPLQNIGEEMAELEKNQKALLHTIHAEKEKLEKIPEFQPLFETMGLLSGYHSKLENMKQELENASNRMEKLKNRAHKLNQKKQKEELTAAERRLKEEERDRQLIAQPSEELKQSQTSSDSEQQQQQGPQIKI